MDASGRTESLRTEAMTYMRTRDLRFYGMTRWSTMDAMAEGDKIRAEVPQSQIEGLAAVYALAIAVMDEQELLTVLRGMKKCPPRPR